MVSPVQGFLTVDAAAQCGTPLHDDLKRNRQTRGKSNE
jgi:hypothetical protein